MKSHFEALFEDAAYRSWFEGWWAADYSVEGCEAKGLDWTINGQFQSPVEFGGRRWGFGWLPPHDLECQFNDGFFLASRFDWSQYAVKRLGRDDSDVRIEGAWLEKLVLQNVRTSKKLNGARAFILGNLQIDSARLELGLRGTFVCGATHLIHLELPRRAVLTASHLRGEVVLRRVGGEALHLNKAIAGGNVSLSEPTLQVDLSHAQIAGNLNWDTAVSRIDARRAMIGGSLRYTLAGSGGRSEWVRLDHARVRGGVEFQHPQIDEVDLRHADVDGTFACEQGNIGELRAVGLRLGAACKVVGTSFGHLDLSSAKLAASARLDVTHARVLRLQNAQMASTLRVRGLVDQVEAGGLRCVAEADFARCTISSDAAFQQARFQGPVNFEGTSFGGRTSFLKATFEAGADFSASVGGDRGGDSFGEISFQAAQFTASPEHLWCARFDGRRFNGLTTFDGSAFRGIPRFYEVEFHEDVSLRYTKFQRAPARSRRNYIEDVRRHPTFGIALRANLNTWNKTQQQYENGYRALKMRMSEVGAARDEHRFLSLELRARRWRFDPEVRPLESAISLLYDITSSYGGSIWRPLAATAFLIGLSASIFYQATPAEVSWERAFDFAFQQVFRPFNVWSDKGDIILASKHSSLEGLFAPSDRELKASPWLKAVASLESLGCLTLLFLTALAIRRRFRLS